MVVAKQVGAGFYKPVHYVLSVALSHLPLALIETATVTLLIYFLAGFTNEAGNYFIFLTTAFLQNLLMSAFFRTIAYATDNADVALNIASPATAFCMLFGGFLIVRDKIPNYAIWLYWLSPFSWGLRINAQTEFHSDRYNGMGDAYLDAFTIQTDDKWIAGLAYRQTTAIQQHRGGAGRGGQNGEWTNRIPHQTGGMAADLRVSVCPLI